MPDLAQLQNWPAQQVACTLLQARALLGKSEQPDIVEAAYIEQRHEIGSRESLLVRHGERTMDARDSVLERFVTTRER